MFRPEHVCRGEWLPRKGDVSILLIERERVFPHRQGCYPRRQSGGPNLNLGGRLVDPLPFDELVLLLVEGLNTSTYYYYQR